MSHTVSSKMQPSVMVTISDAEYELWLELGIVYSGAPIPDTTSYLDTQVAELVDRVGSATRAELRVLMGADAGGLNDGVIAALVPGPSSTATALRAAFGPLLSLPGGYVGGSSPRARRAQFAVGGGGTGFAAPGAATEGHQRVPFRLPVAPTRWRVRIANRNGYDGTAGGAVAMTGLWLGSVNSRANGTYDGNMLAAPSAVTGAFTVPSDGTDYVSGWFTTPLPAASVAQFLSMGWTTAATNLVRGAGSCFVQTGVGTSASASVASPASITSAESGSCYFDIRIEYEFTQNIPVGIAIGGSITEGYAPDYPHVPADKTWHQRLAQRKGIAMCSSAVFGSSAADWTSTTAAKWTRWANSGLTIDFAIVHQGTNDVSSGTDAQTIVTNLQTIVTNLRAAGIKRVYVLTVLPRGDLVHGFMTNLVTSGNTSFLLNKIINGTLVAGDSITLGAGPSLETLTVASVAGSTVTTTTASTQNHQVGEPLAGPKESARHAVNAMLRQQPFDIDGVFDIDNRLRSAIDLGSLEGMFRSSDGTHLRMEGHNQFALAVADLDVLAV